MKLDEGQDRRAWTVGAPLGLFALSFGVRALPWPSVLTPDRVEFFGYDAYYHMRRVLYSLANFPASLEHDPYVAFPTGARPIWPVTFDSALAFLLWPMHRLGGTASVERAAVWIPPLLGAATIVALYFVARRMFGNREALLAGMVLSLLSGHYWYSQIGFIDHHAAVALASTLLLGASMRLFRLFTRGQVIRGAALATGLALGSALALWPGCLLYVGVAELGLLSFLLTREDRVSAHRFARVLCLVNLVALMLVLPFIPRTPWPLWGEFSSVVLSYFQPWLFAASALFAAVCALAWRSAGNADRRSIRWLQAAGIGVSIVVLSLLSFPELLAAGSDAWSWLARDEAFQSQVGESNPLFDVRGQLSGYIAELRLSRFVYFFPLALGVLAFQARRSEDRFAVWFLVGWSAIVLVVTLFQRRFFNSSSVVMALVMGWTGLRMLESALSSRRSRPLRIALATCTVAVFVWLLVPTFAAYHHPLQNQLRTLRGEGLLPDPMGPSKARILEAAEWLRDHTPETSGYSDASAPPEYGVLSDWSYGHVVEYVARRPAVIDNFGDDASPGNFALARQYTRAETEAEGSLILDGLRARYVIVRSGPHSSRGLLERLYDSDGSGLTRHRLIHETSRQRGGFDSRPLKVFEHVQGARLSGRAPAGARVSAGLGLTLPNGRRVHFETETLADAGGRYALRLPHATESLPQGIQTDRRYRIWSGSREARASVTEAEVLAGDELRGPDLGS